MALPRDAHRGINRSACRSYAGVLKISVNLRRHILKLFSTVYNNIIQHWIKKIKSKIWNLCSWITNVLRLNPSWSTRYARNTEDVLWHIHRFSSLPRPRPGSRFLLAGACAPAREITRWFRLPKPALPELRGSLSQAIRKSKPTLRNAPPASSPVQPW